MGGKIDTSFKISESKLNAFFKKIQLTFNGTSYIQFAASLLINCQYV